MKKYYFNDGKAQYGPFTLEELKPQINRETPIWYEGMSDWMLAKDVPEVATVLPPPMAMAKTPPPVHNKPELRKVTYHQEEKSISKWVWIIGGSVAGVIFYFWITSAFVPHVRQEPEPEPVITVDSVGDNEAEITSVNDTYDAEKLIEDHQARLKEDRKKIIISNWTKYITAEIHDYQKRNLGGFNYVRVMVTNNTEYTIDGVRCRVRYIKENGGIFKEEDVIIEGIKPDDFKQEETLGSERGTSVEVEIIQLYSKELGLTYN